MPLPVDIPSIDVLFHTQWHATSKTIRLWASIQAVTTRSPSEYTPTFSVLLECTAVQTTVASGRATTAQSPTIAGCVLHCTTDATHEQFQSSLSFLSQCGPNGNILELNVCVCVRVCVTVCVSVTLCVCVCDTLCVCVCLCQLIPQTHTHTYTHTH
jgi:hypothetical protein